MIVCGRCGYPLSEDVENDPPDACPQCLMGHRNTAHQKWVDYDAYEAERAAKRAKTQPKPKPLPKGLAIAFIGDELHGAGFDWAMCQKFKSKAERRRAYAEAGVNMYSADEYKRRHPSDMAKPGVARFYPGQKDRRSTEERGSPIRTKRGQEIR